MSMGEMVEDCDYWTNDYEDKLLTRLRAVNVLPFLSFFRINSLLRLHRNRGHDLPRLERLTNNIWKPQITSRIFVQRLYQDLGWKCAYLWAPSVPTRAHDTDSHEEGWLREILNRRTNSEVGSIEKQEATVWRYLFGDQRADSAWSFKEWMQ